MGIQNHGVIPSAARNLLLLFAGAELSADSSLRSE